MSEKSPRERWRALEPEGWSQAPRFGVWWRAIRAAAAYALGHVLGALRFAARALVNIDRWNWSAVPPAVARGWQHLRDWLNALPKNYLRVLGWTGVVLVPFWIALIGWVGVILVRLQLDLLDANTGDDWRNEAYAFGALLAALAALFAAPLFLIRAWVSERHTRTAEEGLITERFTRAVEQLGAEKTVRIRAREIKYRLPGEKPRTRLHITTEIEGQTLDLPEGATIRQRAAWQTFERTEPNLEVRLGAIYALERIAQDSERDHIPIMETLSAYIRENAPARTAQDHHLGERPDWPEGGDAEAIATHREAMRERERKLREWAESLPPPRVDVQAALTVLGRRGEDRIEYEKARDFHLDLRNTNLQRADLSGLDLGPARLADARLEGARLMGAGLEEADLRRARSEGALLWGARLQEADLRGARFEGADLWDAGLDGADLMEAGFEGAELVGVQLREADGRGSRLEGANLWFARLEEADLADARLEGANLREARLEGADVDDAELARANLRGADLSSVRNLTQEQINAAFGDVTTKLPEGLVMPDHWDDEPFEGEPWDEDEKYHAWLAAGAPPGKPRTPPPADAPEGGGAPG